MNKQGILDKLNNNPFSKESKVTNVDTAVLFTGILAFIDRDVFRSEFGMSSPSCIEDPAAFRMSTEIVLNAVPEFQRDNDKWTPEMQSSYVLNCLKGFVGAPITLYTLTNQITNCLILDGLQRLTAFSKFLTYRTMTFDIDGEVITSEQMLEACETLPRFNYSSPFEVRILKFNSELEAVQHYIESNENITHSKDDIQRAVAYRDKLLAA